MDAKELNAWRAARAVTEAIWTAGQSPEAAGVKVSEGPGHPLVYDLRVPHGIASALRLGAGANEYAEERIGLALGAAGFVTILQTHAGQDFTTVTIGLGSGAPTGTPAADGPGPAPVVTERLEPGWSDSEPNLHGRCYQRYVPGKGILRVVGLGEAAGGYTWHLGPGRTAELIWATGDRFTGPGDAMRDADRQLAGRPPGMWESLTPGEARLLYVKLAGAEGLDPALHQDLFTQIKIQALDSGYDGPNPFMIEHEAAIRGYAAQLRRAWRDGDTKVLREHQADLALGDAAGEAAQPPAGPAPPAPAASETAAVPTSAARHPGPAGTDGGGFPVANPLASPGPAASTSARRSRVARTAPDTPQKRGR